MRYMYVQRLVPHGSGLRVVSEGDLQYREGGKMIGMPMRSRMIGKAGRIEALRNLTKHMGEKESMWVAKKE